MTFLLIGLALFMGVAATMQPSLNTQIADKVGLGATLVLNGAIVLTGSLLVYWFLPLGDKSGLRGIADLDWYEVLGGVFGLSIVLLATLLFPRLGAGLTFAFALIAQFGLAILFDHYGFFGMPVHEVNLPRVVGFALLIIGAGLIKFF